MDNTKVNTQNQFDFSRFSKEETESLLRGDISKLSKENTEYLLQQDDETLGAIVALKDETADVQEPVVEQKPEDKAPEIKSHWDAIKEGFGYGISDIARGAKQLALETAEDQSFIPISDDIKKNIRDELEEMKVRDNNFWHAVNTSEYGDTLKYAYFTGGLLDPTLMAIPAFKGASIVKGMAAASAAGVAAGGLSYVSTGENRLTNAAFGAALGAGVGGAVQVGKKMVHTKKIANLQNRNLAEDLDIDVKSKEAIDSTLKDAEMVYGELTAKKGMSPVDAVKVMEKDHSTLMKEVKAIEEAHGIGPNFKLATKYYDDMVEAATGSKVINNGLIKAADQAFGLVSTQMRRLSPRIYKAAQQWQYSVHHETQKYYEQVQPFAEWLTNNVKDKNRMNYFKSMLRRGKFDEVRSFMEKNGGDVETFNNAIKAVDEIGDKLVERGLIPKKIKNYFPTELLPETRDEFFEAMLQSSNGKGAKNFSDQGWQTYLKKANEKMQQSQKRPLSEYEEHSLFQSYVQGKPAGGARVRGYAQYRANIYNDEALMPYYRNPDQALYNYIHNAVNDIEESNFFGVDLYKSIMKDTDELLGVADIQKAIKKLEESANQHRTNGSKAVELVNSYGVDLGKEMSKLDEASQIEMRELLRSVFVNGKQSVPSNIRVMQDIIYGSLLSNPYAAILNLGELGVSAWRNGFINTSVEALKTVGDWATKRNTKAFRVREMGLMDTINEEINQSLKLLHPVAAKGLGVKQAAAGFLQKGFKWSGFQHLDRFAKSTQMNAAMKYRAQAARDFINTGKSSYKYRSLKREYQKMFGDEYDSFVKELADFANSGYSKDKITENMRFAAWNELASAQPISLLEVPKMYLDHPYGRSAYMLKTFVLKQIDQARREVFWRLKDGFKKQNDTQIRDGVRELVQLGFYVGGANMGAQKFREWVVGRENFDDTPEELGLAWVSGLIKTWGMDGYLFDEMRKDPVKAAIEFFIPPADVLSDLAWNSWNDKKNAVNEDEFLVNPDKIMPYIPIAGKPYYEWTWGAEKSNMREAELRNENPQMYRKPPGYQPVEQTIYDVTGLDLRRPPSTEFIEGRDITGEALRPTNSPTINAAKDILGFAEGGLVTEPASEEPQWSDQEIDYLRRSWQEMQSAGEDAETSAISSTVVGLDDKQYLIPTVRDGKQLTTDQAVKAAINDGLDLYPSYNSVEEARQRAEMLKMHADMSGYLYGEAGTFQDENGEYFMMDGRGNAAHIPKEIPYAEQKAQELEANPPAGKEGMTHGADTTQGTTKPVQDAVVDFAKNWWYNTDVVDKAALATTPIPVLGDATGFVADMKMYADDPESRTLGNFALTGLGILPFIPNVASTLRFVKGGKKASLEDILETDASPFDGETVSLYRGVETGTIDRAIKGPRELGSHASTLPDMAEGFAEMAPINTGGSVYRTEQPLRKGIVLKDRALNSGKQHLEGLLDHPKFQDPESQRTLLDMKKQFDTEWNTFDETATQFTSWIGDDKIDQPKLMERFKKLWETRFEMEEYQGRAVQQFLKDHGYDHAVYKNTMDGKKTKSLKKGDNDLSLILFTDKPEDWSMHKEVLKPGNAK